MHYQIIEETYYTQAGLACNPKFYVRYQKKNWFGILTWHFHCEKISDTTGSYKRKLPFLSKEEAEYFIKSVLIKNGPHQVYLNKIVAEGSLI